jgi:hypothetical protein
MRGAQLPLGNYRSGIGGARGTFSKEYRMFSFLVFRVFESFASSTRARIGTRRVEIVYVAVENGVGNA